MSIEKINAWKNYLLTLTDERFFSIMRSYLGPIKSPYNKQKLLESLQTFLSKKDIQKKITLFLDTFDKEIISAILILENPTEEKLISFFSGQYSFQEMDEKLSNLTDRLIIYFQSNDNLETFCINPVVEEIISPFVSAEYIFPTQHIETKIASTQKHLSIEFITSVLSYIFKNPDLVKMDGKLKKSSIKKLEQIFPEHFQMIDSLILSFINMDLLKFENKCLVPQWHNIKNFTNLSGIEIISYICLLTDCDLYDYLFQDILELLMQNFILMKDTAFTKNILIRKVFLQKDVFIGKFKRFLYSQPDNSNYKVHFFKKAIERAE
ncbi:MAG: hypothetical protein IKI31_06035, partial [Treponema sp.]|nr:hypothetical protein [Treponema sp.]